jgi:vacuolar-type H+-ATPase subunit F/Vma7
VSRLVVLTTPDLAPGYQLAGAKTLAVVSAEEATSELLSLVEGRGEKGVIAVHEPFHGALDLDLRRRFDETTEPLVVPLPAGEAGEGDRRRRERLLKMLWQAVGYEITFDAEGGKG